MKTYRISTETLIDAPINTVFDFFSKAENLEQLTPKTLKFKILTPLPIEMKMGALIDYKISIRGIPMRWKTEIAIWEPGKRFVDRQLKGPYKQWIHEHRFVPEGTKTRMFDNVDYALPFGPLGQIVHTLFVKREVEGIFRFREQAITQWLASRH
jgi:ligand-binding SRPBCC domain-containing protein